jgi:hypothetical protein
MEAVWSYCRVRVAQHFCWHSVDEGRCLFGRLRCLRQVCCCGEFIGIFTSFQLTFADLEEDLEKANQNQEGENEKIKSWTSSLHTLWRLSQNVRLPGNEKSHWIFDLLLICLLVHKAVRRLIHTIVLLYPKAEILLKSKIQPLWCCALGLVFQNQRVTRVACHAKCNKVMQRDLGHRHRFLDVWPPLIDVTHDGFNSFTWNGYSGILDY